MSATFVAGFAWRDAIQELVNMIPVDPSASAVIGAFLVTFICTCILLMLEQLKRAKEAGGRMIKHQREKMVRYQEVLRNGWLID